MPDVEGEIFQRAAPDGGRPVARVARLPKLELAVLLVAAVAAVALLAGVGFNRRALWYAQEYGPLESLQLLLVTVCLYLFASSYKNGVGVVKIGGGALALLSLAAFVRELDVKKFHGPDWYQWIANRGLQEILFVGVLAVMFVYLWRQRSHWPGLLNLLLRRQAIPLFFAGGLILLSQYLDGSTVSGRDPMFWEEVAELCGYALLAVAAFRHRLLVE